MIARRDNLRRLAPGSFKEAPSVLAQDHVLTAVVALVEPQCREPVDDLLLVRRAVGGFREQRVEPCVGVEDRFPLRPATKVQGLGPVEEVLQVETPLCARSASTCTASYANPSVTLPRCLSCRVGIESPCGWNSGG